MPTGVYIRTKQHGTKIKMGLNKPEILRKLSLSHIGKKLSEEQKRKISEAVKGKKHPMWNKIKKNVSYGSKHDYVKRRLKKPKKCFHCHKIKKLDLANKSGKYLRDLSDWFWLCRKCHYKYDKMFEKTGKYLKLGWGWNKGKKYSEEMCKKFSESHKGLHSSPKTEFKKGMIPWNKGKKYKKINLYVK